MIPIKRYQVRSKNSQWLDPQTVALMSTRDQARKKARETDDDNDWENFRYIRNVCTEKVK